MTVENCIKLLEAYKKQAENPVDERGRELTGVERTNAQEQSKKNYEMMKAHILKSRKFRGHPIFEIEEHFPEQAKAIKEAKEAAEKAAKEEKKDGKKSKR